MLNSCLLTIVSVLCFYIRMTKLCVLTFNFKNNFNVEQCKKSREQIIKTCSRFFFLCCWYKCIDVKCGDDSIVLLILSFSLYSCGNTTIINSILFDGLRLTCTLTGNYLRAVFKIRGNQPQATYVQGILFKISKHYYTHC